MEGCRAFLADGAPGGRITKLGAEKLGHTGRTLAHRPEKEAMQRQFDVFLSYKKDDEEWVQRLKQALQERGVEVWLDKERIRPGDLFAQALERGSQLGRSRTPCPSEG